MKNQPLCSIAELNQVFAFTMNDGEKFQASGFNSYEAFTSVKSPDEWVNMADCEYLAGVPAPDIEPIEEEFTIVEDEEEFVIVE